MEKNGPIGIFDSGVGGLTVLKKLMELCPSEQYVYFGDTKNVPYGEKSKEELRTAVNKIFGFFQRKNVKAVVMACNTTSALLYDELKKSYKFEIYPIIQIAAKCIAASPELKRVGVFATTATVNSKAYTKYLKEYNPQIEVYEVACPEWVELVENTYHEYDERGVILQHLKEMEEFKPQKIILGCTHYPYLMEKFSMFVDPDIFIDPSEHFARYVAQHVEKSMSAWRGYAEYFVSSNPEKFVANAKPFMGLSRVPDLVSL